MNYYTVPIVGSGTTDDPFRPDIPEGTAFAGNIAGGQYLIVTAVDLPQKVGRDKQWPRQVLEDVCNTKGIKFDDVIKWFAT